jgi:ABC-type proline/glycine betaine transport system substrate-binding protein
VIKTNFIRKALNVVFSMTMAVVLILIGVLSGCGGDDTSKKVTFADASWDSIQLHNRIAAYILENGYDCTVEYTFGDTIPLFNGLARGDIDVCMEVWSRTSRRPMISTSPMAVLWTLAAILMTTGRGGWCLPI